MSKQGRAWRSVELAEEERLTAGVVHHRSPCWSADGKWLAFVADTAWVIVDRRGRVARVLEGPPDGAASFSPGGAFAFGKRGEIWMSPGGGAPAVRLLGGDGGRYRDPTFSPDGSLLVMAHSPDGGPRTRLFSLEVATGVRQRLTGEAPRYEGHPVFSPDGSLLFFESDDGAIHVLDWATRQVSRTTPEGARFRSPAPLSTELLVAERQEGEGPPRLALVEWRKQRSRPLLEGDAEERDPAACRTQKGKVRLAWSTLPAGENGKPRRSDIAIARVHNVDAVTNEVLPLAPGLEKALEAAR